MIDTGWPGIVHRTSYIGYRIGVYARMVVRKEEVGNDDIIQYFDVLRTQVPM